MLKRLLAPFASLTLTVILVVLAMVLIYAGTWAQVDTGIWTVQKKYFHTLVTWIDFQTLLPRPQPGQSGIPGGFPMPGGYAIGTLMLLNLLAACVVRFNFNWKDIAAIPLLAGSYLLMRAWEGNRSGVILAAALAAGAAYLAIVLIRHAQRSGLVLVHIGIALLLIGEGITSTVAVESQMTLDEGSYANYAQDTREIELAVVDPSPGNHDIAMTIDGSRVAQKGTIRDARLPFEIRIDDFFGNSAVFDARQAPAGVTSKATAGEGRGLAVMERPRVSGTEGQSIDAPSAYLTLAANGKELGTYLVSLYFETPQRVEVDGKSYLLQLRFKRYYKPYTIHLIDFKHDRYTGTEVARNFSSRVRLVDPRFNEDREETIWMNHPLRYRGETFYQASFKPGDQTSILQVVQNPGWLMPYFACVIGALGLAIHFVLLLVDFLGAERPARSDAPVARDPRTVAAVVVPIAGVVVCLLMLVAAARPPKFKSPYNIGAFAALPISFDGRTQPLDSVARNSLRIISNKDSFKVDGRRVAGIEWLLDVLARPERAEEYKVFRIDHPDVISLLNLKPDEKLFSAKQIMASGERLNEQYQRASSADPRQRSLFQKQILNLATKLNLYFRLSQPQSLYLVPPIAGSSEWKTLGDTAGTEQQHPAVQAFASIVGNYHHDRAEQFNSDLAAYRTRLATEMPKAMTKVNFEVFFNRFEPFIQCMAMYVLVFLLACLSWLVWQRPLAGAAYAVLLIAFLVHSAGLLGRIYMQGRPPVTNLYSSAVYIGWGAALLAIFLERVLRNGIGSIAAAVVGFTSLLIAHHLAGDGDTMRMLQAVLDTNFWLATHVLTITMGYTAMFVAGVLAILYLLLGMFTPALRNGAGRQIAGAVFGVTCFGLLFNFVGTVLGGIWADQSWGRFWGWDPKENGAVLIVLWGALMVHARWAKLVGDRGFALLAIAGNIVTSWSWFGTNMLGVGLHSYGFMDSALFWLLMFVASQLLLIGLGLVPLNLWRSFSAELSVPVSLPTESKA